VGPRAGLDAVEKRKITAPIRNRTRSRITVLTELHQIMAERGSLIHSSMRCVYFTKFYAPLIMTSGPFSFRINF
jgi:hypothetical protein